MHFGNGAFIGSVEDMK